jgi:hypothetical protein
MKRKEIKKKKNKKIKTGKLKDGRMKIKGEGGEGKYSYVEEIRLVTKEEGNREKLLYLCLIRLCILYCTGKFIS